LTRIIYGPLVLPNETPVEHSFQAPAIWAFQFYHNAKRKDKEHGIIFKLAESRHGANLKGKDRNIIKILLEIHVSSVAHLADMLI
jgi:hypothetical protein